MKSSRIEARIQPARAEDLAAVLRLLSENGLPVMARHTADGWAQPAVEKSQAPSGAGEPSMALAFSDSSHRA